MVRYAADDVKTNAAFLEKLQRFRRTKSSLTCGFSAVAVPTTTECLRSSTDASGRSLP
jgi:hypothetical protein